MSFEAADHVTMNDKFRCIWCRFDFNLSDSCCCSGHSPIDANDTSHFDRHTHTRSANISNLVFGFRMRFRLTEILINRYFMAFSCVVFVQRVWNSLATLYFTGWHTPRPWSFRMRAHMTCWQQWSVNSWQEFSANRKKKTRPKIERNPLINWRTHLTLLFSIVHAK